MTDVIVVGGGPAGSIAALVLARAGVRVTLIDRAVFPREKLCGDSVNPGAMALLGRLGLGDAVEARGLPVRGMLLTGPDAEVRGRYPRGHLGRSLRRLDLDTLLLDAAARAGVSVEQGTRVAGPLVDGLGDGARVVGLRAGRDRSLTARLSRVVIAADGRRSAFAFGLGLARQPRRPRRWAMGAYFENVGGLSDLGEMHVRQGHYLGVAPMPGGLTNACLVVPEHRARLVGAGTAQALEAAICSDPRLAERFRAARRVTAVTTLGPLAVDVRVAGIEGLLLAGDAAGFVDPMTGDGLRLALRGGELAAEAALEALQGQRDAHVRLADRRRKALGRKLRVNRLLRSLVDVPVGVSLAAAVARLWPDLLSPLTSYAGDVSSARADQAHCNRLSAESV